jgi:tetratricopeptide (TPR) repeat protein
MSSLKIILRFFLALALSAAAFADVPPPEKLLSEGRVDEAISSLQARLNSGSHDPQSYNYLCRAYYQLENWDAGISACEKAVALDPNSSLYHLWLGRIYGEKADTVSFFSAAGFAKKLRNEFETAVKLDPKSVPARTDLAEFYLEAPGIVGGGRDKAEAQAQALFSLNPQKAHWVLGRIAEKKKDFPTAEKEYRAGLEASHGSAEGWLDLALFFRHTQRLDDMVKAVEQLAAAPVTHSDTLVDGADTLIRSGRNLPTASKLLRRYLSSGNTTEQAPVFKAHYLLGTALEKQGDKQGAADEYRAALALAKSFSRARDALNRLNR